MSNLPGKSHHPVTTESLRDRADVLEAEAMKIGANGGSGHPGALAEFKKAFAGELRALADAVDRR